jgi:hypothetical protein
LSRDAPLRDVAPRALPGDGIGIFRKIKEECHLDDERHAVFELAKDELTTDPEHHTGEGIFFTSRMFDRLSIISGPWSVTSSGQRGDDWVMEDRADPVQGTLVIMKISPLASRTTREVFERYATAQDDYAFSRTHVVVALAQQAQEDKLVSRSQARRVMARLERFREVVLNFRGIDDVGPAFADEIFRVFRARHPGTNVTPVGMNPAVEGMVRRALSAAGQAGSPTAPASGATAPPARPDPAPES